MNKVQGFYFLSVFVLVARELQQVENDNKKSNKKQENVVEKNTRIAEEKNIGEERREEDIR